MRGFMTERVRIAAGAAALWAVAAAGGAASIGSAEASGTLSVVATTGQVGDVLRNVAGERAEVEVLMGEGVDPHGYRQTRSDIARMSAADAVFWNGLYLEAQLESFLDDLAEVKPVVALGEKLDESVLLEDEVYPGRYDPHIWMDPRLWSGVVEAAADALSGLDPDGAEIYAENAAAYVAELEALDGYARSVLHAVPEHERVLITAHDAFNYFGRAYDYEVMGIQGLSTESEAGIRQIEDLVDAIVSRGIPAVFVETSVADRNVRALVEGAAARGHEVVIGGALFSDAMGAPGTYEGTYVGMFDHNVTVMSRALGGGAPEDGMTGRLAAGS